MLMPYRSLADPEVQGEGSIDPLGLAKLADRLGDWILPGMTARMWRPRFLTAIAVSSIVVEPFEDELGKDGISPPWLVLEWYYVEAIAGMEYVEEGALRRVPGIDKARRALRDKVPMNADRYLKTPKVFGFHGVYKRLARHVHIVDDRLMVEENGIRLLKVWEEEQGIPGFSDQQNGNVAKTLRSLREALTDALKKGQTERQTGWPGASFFVDHLSPHQIGPREREFLWGLLLDQEAEPRGEMFTLMTDPEIRRQFADEADERAFLRQVRNRASEGLQRRIDAIEAYEEFCRPIQEAWDHLRHMSTVNQSAGVTAGDMAAEARVSILTSNLQRAIESGREVLGETLVSQDFDNVAQAFETVRSGEELFHTLWSRHVTVQKEKPPEGKRPWFEAAADGRLIIRSPYRMAEAPPPQERFVHPYRASAVASFVNDIWGAS